MPRIRYLKPDFFTDEDLAELSLKTRLCYAGLWCHADKAGRMEYRPKYLKAMIFPYDSADMEMELNILAKNKRSGIPFIQFYSSDGKTFIQILQWDKHQKPHNTEKESEIPPAPPLNTTENGDGKGNGNGEGPKQSLELDNVYLTVKTKKINAIPTLEEISSYCKERFNSISPQAFFDHYTCNGWMVGRNKMKDWKAAVRTWEQRAHTTGALKRSGVEEAVQRTMEWIPPEERGSNE